MIAQCVIDGVIGSDDVFSPHTEARSLWDNVRAPAYDQAPEGSVSQGVSSVQNMDQLSEIVEQVTPN